jgi:O-succinylbenzoic acid--CoA ligase
MKKNTSSKKISLNDEVRRFLLDWNDDSQYIEVSTSGSTGKPKIIKIEKKKMIISAQKTIDLLKIPEKSKALLCLSPNTIAGKMMIVRAIVGNLELIIGEHSSNPLQNISEVINFTAMVPMQVANSLKFFPEKLRSIDKIIIGGAPITSELENNLKHFNNELYQTFGMTETISHVALRKINSKINDYYEGIDGVIFSIENNLLNITYPEISEDIIKTNDVVELLSPKRFKWIGRADFSINTGGIKYLAEEIERKIQNIIPNSFFIAGIPDELLGEKIVLIIESNQPVQFRKKDFLNLISRFETPKFTITLPKFIKTNSGKINRIATLKLIHNHVAFEIL